MKYMKVPLQGDSVEALKVAVDKELSTIEQVFREQDEVRLVMTYVAPSKPRDGQTMLADGTSWNPGSGAGVYTYYGSAWHKLG